MWLLENKFISFLLRIISFIFLPLLLIVLVPLISYRLLVWSVVKLRYGSKYELMPTKDAVFSNYEPGMNTTRKFRNILKATAVFEGDMTLEKLRNYFVEAYFNTSAKEQCDFKLNYVPVSILGVLFYNVQKDRFQPEQHIIPFSSATSPATPVTETQVMEWLSNNITIYYDNGAPWWKIYFVKDFVYDKERANTDTPRTRKWAIIVCFHHYIGDSIHTIQNILFRMNKERWLPINTSKRQVSKPIQYLKGIFGMTSIVKEILKTRFLVDHYFRRNRYSGSRHICWSSTIAIEDIQMNVSSIVITAIAEAIRQYNLAHNFTSVDDIYVPISVTLKTIEKSNKTLKNVVSGACLRVPTSDMTLSKRLSIVNQTLESELNSSFYFALPFLLMVGGSLPLWVTKLYKKDVKHPLPQTFSFSAIPGPEAKNIYLFGGSKLLDLVGWFPTAPTMGLTAALVQLSGKFRLGVTVDTSIFETRKETQEFTDMCAKYINKIICEVLAGDMKSLEGVQ